MQAQPDRSQSLLGFCLLSITAFVAGGAVGPRIVYSTFTSYAESNVPGVSGAKFVWLDRPGCDPNGDYIVFTADANGDPNGNQVLTLRPAALSATGLLKAREGSSISGTGLTNGPMRGRLAVRWDGSFAYSTNAAGDPNADEVIVKHTEPNTYAIAAREGNSVPG